LRKRIETIFSSGGWEERRAGKVFAKKKGNERISQRRRRKGRFRSSSKGEGNETAARLGEKGLSLKKNSVGRRKKKKAAARRHLSI